jgi:histone H3/H4
MALKQHGDAMNKLIFDIMEELGHTGYRPISADAIKLLKTAGEDFLVDVFAKAGLSATGRKRVKVSLADFQLACSTASSSPRLRHGVHIKVEQDHPQDCPTTPKARKTTPAKTASKRSAAVEAMVETQQSKRRRVAIDAALIGSDAKHAPRDAAAHQSQLPGNNSFAATLTAWKSTETPVAIMKPWEFSVDEAANAVDEKDFQDDERTAARIFLNKVKRHGAAEAFLDLPSKDQELHTACCIGQLAAYESWRQRRQQDSRILDWHELNGDEKNAFVPADPLLFLRCFEHYQDLLHVPNADSYFRRLMEQ